MGLFGSIFGRKTEEYSANDAKILCALVALRISRSFEAQGYSPNEAQALTDEVIKKEGLYGDKILSVPDGVVQKIIMDYVKILSHNINEAKKRKIVLELNGFRQLTIEHIENFRNQLLGLPEIKNFPRTIDAYVFYRVQREVEFLNKTNPEGMGFSKDTVQLMTNLLKGVYGRDIYSEL